MCVGGLLHLMHLSSSSFIANKRLVMVSTALAQGKHGWDGWQGFKGERGTGRGRGGAVDALVQLKLYGKGGLQCCEENDEGGL